MRKTQLALAAVALVASSAALAQDSVQIYGNIDAGFMSSKSANQGFLACDAGACTANPLVNRVSRSSIESGLISPNFLGFRGSEDLGGGLKADFHLQTAYNAVSGGGFAFTQSDIGLAADGVGTVRIGRTVDPMWAQGVAQFDAAGGANIGSAVTPVLDMGLSAVFPKNSLTYLSPSIGGLTVAGQIRQAPKPGSGLVEAGAPDSWNKGGNGNSVTVTYGASGLTVGAGFATNHAVAWDKTGDPLATANYDYNKNRSSFYGVGYDAGFAKVNVLYMMAKNTDQNGVAVANGAKMSTTGVNGSIPLGATRLVAGYYSARSEDVDGARDGKSTMYHLTAFYDLSKRSSLFANYQSVKSTEGLAVIPLGLNVGSAVPTYSFGGASAFTLGVRHTF